MVGNIMRDLGGASQRIAGREFNGIVVDNNDPERLQRCRVRVRDLHNGIPDNQIPWATKRDGSTRRVDVSPLGAGVKVMFNDESLYYPTYFGAVLEGDAARAPADGYPHVVQETDQAGNSIRRDTREGSNTFTYSHVSGATFHIDNAGNISVKTPKKIKFEAGEDIEFLTLGAVKVHAAGTMDFRSGGAAFMQSGAALNLRSSSILGTTPVVSTGTPAQTPSAPSATTPGSRPVISRIENDLEY